MSNIIAERILKKQHVDESYFDRLYTNPKPFKRVNASIDPVFKKLYREPRIIAKRYGSISNFSKDDSSAYPRQTVEKPKFYNPPKLELKRSIDAYYEFGGKKYEGQKSALDRGQTYNDLVEDTDITKLGKPQAEFFELMRNQKAAETAAQKGKVPPVMTSTEEPKLGAAPSLEKLASLAGRSQERAEDVKAGYASPRANPKPTSAGGGTASFIPVQKAQRTQSGKGTGEETGGQETGQETGKGEIINDNSLISKVNDHIKQLGRIIKQYGSEILGLKNATSNEEFSKLKKLSNDRDYYAKQQDELKKQLAAIKIQRKQKSNKLKSDINIRVENKKEINDIIRNLERAEAAFSLKKKTIVNENEGANTPPKLDLSSSRETTVMKTPRNQKLSRNLDILTPIREEDEDEPTTRIRSSSAPAELPSQQQIKTSITDILKDSLLDQGVEQSDITMTFNDFLERYEVQQTIDSIINEVNKKLKDELMKKGIKKIKKLKLLKLFIEKSKKINELKTLAVQISNEKRTTGELDGGDRLKGAVERGNVATRSTPPNTPRRIVRNYPPQPPSTPKEIRDKQAEERLDMANEDRRMKRFNKDEAKFKYDNATQIQKIVRGGKVRRENEMGLLRYQNELKKEEEEKNATFKTPDKSEKKPSGDETLDTFSPVDIASLKKSFKRPIGDITQKIGDSEDLSDLDIIEKFLYLSAKKKKAKVINDICLKDALDAYKELLPPDEQDSRILNSRSAKIIIEELKSVLFDDYEDDDDDEEDEGRLDPDVQKQRWIDDNPHLNPEVVIMLKELAESTIEKLDSGEIEDTMELMAPSIDYWYHKNLGKRISKEITDDLIKQYKIEGGTDNKLIKRRNAEAIAQAIDVLKNDNLNTPNKGGKKGGSAEKEDDVSRRETMNPGYDPTSLLTGGGDKTPNIFGGKRKGSLKAVRDTDPNYEDLLKRSTLNEGLRINPMFER